MRDFTFKLYRNLIYTLKNQGFSFFTMEDYCRTSGFKGIILRHDVDRLPMNSLRFAEFQNEMGIRGTYYFRVVPQSYDENIIRSIYNLGHEIGYHYEDINFTNDKLINISSLFSRKHSHNEYYLAEKALINFENNLKRFREIVPVNTICMHGSPMKRLDNRILWKYFDYHDFNIIGEPYFDINADEVLVLSDTGRRWDGSSVSIRDKMFTSSNSVSTEKNNTDFTSWKVKPVTKKDKPVTTKEPHFKTTFEIIIAAKNNLLPDRVLMTFHPQRWSDDNIIWFKELVLQNIKNSCKYFINKYSAY